MAGNEAELSPDGPLFGLDDQLFEQRHPRGETGGLITKREVRAVSLARLALQSNSIVWDIGAGSGAVAIEAARLCREGQVWAVEKNPADVALCRRNIERSGCANIRLIEGLAPEACREWPAPQAVFIGGSGGHLTELIALSASRLVSGGWLVVNLATFENLQECLQALATHGFEADVTLVQVSRSQPLLGLTRLEALNPVFVVAATRNTIKQIVK